MVERLVRKRREWKWHFAIGRLLNETKRHDEAQSTGAQLESPSHPQAKLASKRAVRLSRRRQPHSRSHRHRFGTSNAVLSNHTQQTTFLRRPADLCDESEYPQYNLFSYRHQIERANQLLSCRR
jgi:hypothetical protein